MDFNSHARVGRDIWPFRMMRDLSDFNSHARVGRDNLVIDLVTGLVEFQLTRPRGA